MACYLFGAMLLYKAVTTDLQQVTINDIQLKIL